MYILNKWLEEDEIEQIIEGYNEKIIEQLDPENMLKILQYLLENKVTYLKDIIIEYLDVFLLDFETFKEKFTILKEKYGILLIGENLSLLESMVQ